MKSSHLCIILLVLCASCSRKSDKDLYQEGKAAHELQHFDLALDRYQAVVDQAPKSAYAESSQYRMAVIYNNDLHDNSKAIQAYQKFCTKFPASDKAPSALFLIGFLYNNELHNSDSARRVYETFLQKYPEHSLAASAKFELETLGKDPTLLLQSRVASEGSDKSRKSSNAAKQ